MGQKQARKATAILQEMSKVAILLSYHAIFQDYYVDGYSHVKYDLNGHDIAIVTYL